MAPREIIEIEDSDDECIVKEPLTTGNILSESDLEFEDDENEPEQKPLIFPSTDIKADFEDTLQDGFQFDGAFAFSERYGIGDTPNPCLHIDGLGTIGIPLSPREALAIISAGIPVGNSGTNASGIWEISSEKVHFDNPAWGDWIQKTAGEAAADALDAYGGVWPSFTLKKLVIHEPGCSTSHYKEQISDDESDTKIGDLVAILPSVFQGGQFQLSYAGQVKSLNLAHQSGLSTSIIAAYVGVEHTLASVTSGYRLSLLYDMVQPITHAEERPTLPEMQGATQKLHNIMLSWKQNASGGVPDYLACLLRHRYAKSPNFGAKSLTGADALLVHHLRPLARRLKFRLYLAHLRGTVTTTAEALTYSSDGESDMSDIDDAEFEDDGEDAQEILEVTQVVDLRGMPVDVDLELGDDDVINGNVTDGDPQTTTLQKEGRTTATRTKVYNRTVLLLWPKNSDLDLSVAVGDIYDYAFNALQSSLTDIPTKRERRLVNQLLVCCQTRRSDTKLPQAVQVLRESADRWNDVEMLLRALKACGVDKNIDLMGVEGFVSAYQAFGWDALKNFYGDTMQNDESNARRYALLARLTQMGVEEDDANVSLWCQEQLKRVLGSLGKVDATQIPWLARAGLAHGGDFLCDVIFPQLQAQKLEPSFWIPFSRCLQQHMKDVPTTFTRLVGRAIAQSVSQIARDLPAFPTKVGKSTRPNAERQEEDCDSILKVVQLCVETNNEALCPLIFARMRDVARAGSFNAGPPPWVYYAKLSTSFVRYMESITGLDDIFQPFFLDAIDSMVSPARTTSDGKATTPCPLSEKNQATIILAARTVCCASTSRNQSFKADPPKGQQSSTLQALARYVMKEFSPQLRRDPAAFKAFGQVIITLVRAAICTFDTSSLVKRYIPPTASQRMIAIIDFCFEVGGRSQCQYLLPRFVPPPTGTTATQHVSGVLAPFLPDLQEYLVGKDLNFEAEPYKTFAVTVAKLFAEKVMTPKPSEPVPASKLRAIGCGCRDCKELKAFFQSAHAVVCLPAVQKIRLHLERELAKTRAWGVSWQTVKKGSPRMLEVTKPPAMVAFATWSANSQTGKTLLLSLGDLAAQTRVLGADHYWVYARIYGATDSDLPMPLGDANRTINAPKRMATTALPTKPTKRARTS
ncbi:hypothetical protein B0H14DRAFT_2698032 [Mycena olivaceomarginata]|nr:hypothetical protein B0H14DRAFT_2698032 [Mycena olivaceomarginata]